jgi:phospholipase D1/2
MIVDDRFLRIGSSNLNNRSLGFDSECDLALEAWAADRDDIRRHIEHMRDDLLAEHLGVSVDAVRSAAAQRQSTVGAVEALRGTGRSLRKFTEYMVAADAGPFAENDLMDPDHVPASLAQTLCATTIAAVLWPLTQAAPGLWSTIRAVTDQVRTFAPDLERMGTGTPD